MCGRKLHRESCGDQLRRPIFVWRPQEREFGKEVFMGMILFPLVRSVRLKLATASSRVATFPMFVRSRGVLQIVLPKKEAGKKVAIENKAA
jgi:hypothetical protein